MKFSQSLFFFKFRIKILAMHSHLFTLCSKAAYLIKDYLATAAVLGTTWQLLQFYRLLGNCEWLTTTGVRSKLL